MGGLEEEINVDGRSSLPVAELPQNLKGKTAGRRIILENLELQIDSIATKPTIWIGIGITIRKEREKES